MLQRAIALRPLHYYLRCLLLGFSVFYFIEASARNHYISGSGNDHSNGRSPGSAWRGVNRLNKISLLPSDTVFLQRRGTYEGTILVRRGGTALKPIVVMAYGEGADPVVSGSTPVKNWKAVENKRYEAFVQQPVYDLYLDGQRLTPARYPDNGCLTIDNAYGKDSIGCSRLQEEDAYWNGATLRIRFINWVYETRAVQSYQKGFIIQGPQDRDLVEKSFEQGSSVVSTATEWAKGLQPTVYVNDTHNEKLVVPGAGSRLPDSTTAPGKLTLAPYSSYVILEPKKL